MVPHRVDRVVTDENLPRAGIARLCGPHSPWKDYYDTHRFVSALLIYFDQDLALKGAPVARTR